MAVKDVVLTLTGSNAVAKVVHILANDDGSSQVIVAGETKDSNGNPVTLTQYRAVFQPGQLAALDNLLATALSQLRKLNGLE